MPAHKCDKSNVVWGNEQTEALFTFPKRAWLCSNLFSCALVLSLLKEEPLIEPLKTLLHFVAFSLTIEYLYVTAPGSSPRLLHRWLWFRLCLFLFARSTLQNKTWRPGSTTKHQQARHGRQETAPQVAPFPFSISQAFVCARWRVNPALCVSVKKSVMLDNWRVQIPRFVQKEFHCYNAAGNRGKTRRRKPRVNWNFVTLLIFLFESSWKHSFCFSLCSNKEKNESKKSMDYGAGTLICCFSLFLNSQQTRD